MVQIFGDDLTEHFGQVVYQNLADPVYELPLLVYWRWDGQT